MQGRSTIRLYVPSGVPVSEAAGHAAKFVAVHLYASQAGMQDRHRVSRDSNLVKSAKMPQR